MSDIICVTNRRLCREDFLLRIEKIARCAPRGMILREKDLPEDEYRQLAERVTDICRKYGVPCILHSFTKSAATLGADKIHLPMHILRQLEDGEKQQFTVIGASCHSAAEAEEAQSLGATYITAGHIFVTNCKKGLAPRGLDFLRDVCRSVTIPVYAIGGIDSGNIAEVRNAGTSGGCVMSGLMQCEDPEEYLKKFKEGDPG